MTLFLYIALSIGELNLFIVENRAFQRLREKQNVSSLWCGRSPIQKIGLLSLKSIKWVGKILVSTPFNVFKATRDWLST